MYPRPNRTLYLLQVADFLLSFGRATDEGNLFFLFTA